MKKIISIMLLLCMCFGIVSCKSNGPENKSYESKIIDEDALFQLEVFKQYGVIGGESITEKNIPDKTIEFMGKAYTGRYDYSYVPIDDLMPSYKSYYDNEQRVRFKINDATGEIIAFSRDSKDVAAEEKETGASPDYQKFMIDARNMAEKYVGDLSEYDIYLEDLDLNPTDNSLAYGWKITYTKTVLGYPTSSYISISMSNSGIIEEFRIGDLGAFDDFEEEIDAQRVSESIKSALTKAYVENGATICNIMYSDKYLFKSSDGKFCLLSDVTVYLKYADGTEKIENPLLSTTIKN